MNISRQLLTISIFLNENPLEPPLEEMTGSSPFDIEVGRVGSVNMMKNLREVSSRCFQQKMIVIPHEAISMDDSSITIMSGFKVG